MNDKSPLSLFSEHFQQLCFVCTQKASPDKISQSEKDACKLCLRIVTKSMTGCFDPCELHFQSCACTYTFIIHQNNHPLVWLGDSKGRLTRYDFVARNKLTTGLTQNNFCFVQIKPTTCLWLLCTSQKNVVGIGNVEWRELCAIFCMMWTAHALRKIVVSKSWTI